MDLPRVQDFDFDTWSRLAGADPEAFERARRQVIETVIAQAPVDRRRRMAGLQWRIDRLREQAPNPMAACLRLSAMMWDSVLGENGLVETLEKLGRLDTSVHKRPATATVLPLRSRAVTPEKENDKS